MASTQAPPPPQSFYAHQASTTSAVPSWASGNPELFHMDSDEMLVNQPNITQNILDPTSSHPTSSNALGITDNSTLGSSTANMMNITNNMFSASVENPKESLGLQLQVPSAHQMPAALTLLPGRNNSRPSLQLDVPSSSNSEFSHSPLSGSHAANLTGGLGLELDVPLPERGYDLLNHNGSYVGSYDSSHSYSHSRDHSPARSPFGGSPYPPSSPNHSAAGSLAAGSPYPFPSSPRDIPLPPSGRQTPLFDTRDISAQSPMSNGGQPSPSPTAEGVGKLRGRLPHPLIQSAIKSFNGHPHPASAPAEPHYPSLAQGVATPFESEVEGPKDKSRQLPPSRRFKAHMSQSAHPDTAPHHSPFSNDAVQMTGHGGIYTGGAGGGRRASNVNDRFARGVGGAGGHGRRPSDARGTSPYAAPSALPPASTVSNQGVGAAMPMARRMHSSGGSNHGLGLNTNININNSTSYTSNDLNQNLSYGSNPGLTLALPEIEHASNVGNEHSQSIIPEFQFDPLHNQQFLQPRPLAGSLNTSASLHLQGLGGAQNTNFPPQSQSHAQSQSQLQSNPQNYNAPWSPHSVDNEEHPPPSPSVFSPSGISPVGSGSHPHSPWTSHPGSPRHHLMPVPNQAQAQAPAELFAMDPTTSSTDKSDANEAVHMQMQMAVDPQASQGAETQTQSYPWTVSEINKIFGFDENQTSLSMRANNSNFEGASNLGASAGAVGADPLMASLAALDFGLANPAPGVDFMGLIGDVPTSIPQPMGTPLPYMQTLPSQQVQGVHGLVTEPTSGLGGFQDFASSQDVPPLAAGTVNPWGRDGQLRSNSYDQFMEDLQSSSQAQTQPQPQPQPHHQQIKLEQIPQSVQESIDNILSAPQPQHAMAQPSLGIPQHPNRGNRPRAYSSTSDRSPSPNPAGVSRNRSLQAAHQAHRRIVSLNPLTPQITVTQHGEHGSHGMASFGHAPSAPPFTQVHQPGLQQYQQQPQLPSSAPAYSNMPQQNIYQHGGDNMALYQQMPPMTHAISYPPPNAPGVVNAVNPPAFPQPNPYKEEYSDYSDHSAQQDVYYGTPSNPNAGADLGRNISNPLNQGHKQQQPGQRHKVDEKLLQIAFTEQSAHPDPALRKLLDIVLESTFYRDETLEPMQGTPEADAIFAQVRAIPPNDPRFAPKSPNGDAVGLNAPGTSYGGFGNGNGNGGDPFGQNDGLGPQRDAQSIYNLFQESNSCLICCNKQTDRNARALAHIRSDLGHRPYHCTGQNIGCNKCQKTDHPRKFFSHNLLEDHISGQNKKQKCTQCQTSIRRGGMSRHWKAKHPEMLFTGRDND